MEGHWHGLARSWVDRVGHGHQAVPDKSHFYSGWFHQSRAIKMVDKVKTRYYCDKNNGFCLTLQLLAVKEEKEVKPTKRATLLAVRKNTSSIIATTIIIITINIIIVVTVTIIR